METYHYQSTPEPNQPRQAEKKIPAALLAILIPIGIHKFLLGYQKEGIIQVVLTLVTCGIFGIVSYIEGILYLFTPDKDFDAQHNTQTRPWF